MKVFSNVHFVRAQRPSAENRKTDLTPAKPRYPTGCSKWNPVEHRLFSFISINWAGKPLRTLATMLGYIRDTETETGLRVEAVLLPGHYPKGVKVSKQAWKTVRLHRLKTCPNWNYTISPHRRKHPDAKQ